MTRSIYDATTGEWIGPPAEDYHEALPEHDPHWGLALAALAACVAGCALVALAYAIAWGLP